MLYGYSQDTPVKLLLRMKKARRAQERNDPRILELDERWAKKIMTYDTLDEERMKLVERFTEKHSINGAPRCSLAVLASAGSRRMAQRAWEHFEML